MSGISAPPTGTEKKMKSDTASATGRITLLTSSSITHRWRPQSRVSRTGPRSEGKCGTRASGYRANTDLPRENVSRIGMNSRFAGSAVSGFSPRMTRSACLPTAIEPLVSSSKYW